eukprot:6102516-Pyramimonas_sp.AAC.1
MPGLPCCLEAALDLARLLVAALPDPFAAAFGAAVGPARGWADPFMRLCMIEEPDKGWCLDADSSPLIGWGSWNSAG